MASPISRTVPTSARSVSTSASAIRCFRIEVISSGRSFKFFSLAVDQFFAELVEAAADARVGAHGAGLDDDAADDVGVDRTRGDDAPARGLLDLLDDLGGLLLRELDRGGELQLEDALFAREQPAELRVDRLGLGDSSLLREEVDEVEEDRVRAGEEVVERRELRLGLHLRVAEKPAQLVGLGERGRERVELLPHARDGVLVPGGLEKRLGVHTLDDGQSAS